MSSFDLVSLIYGGRFLLKYLSSKVLACYFDRNLQERTMPIADNTKANAIKTAKSTRILFIPVAPIRSCLVASLA